MRILSYFNLGGSLLLSLATALLATAVMGHPGLHEQERAADAALAQKPNDPDLHLTRGKLHVERGEWDAALAAYHRARELGADVATVAKLEGDAFLAAEWPQTAKLHYDAAIEARPGSASAHVGRARAWMALERPAEAERDLEVAFGALESVPPGLVLERRDVLLAAGETEAALRMLDAQIEHAGPVPALQMAAVDLEVAERRYDAALRRIDGLLAGIPNHPLWATRRAEILQAAGRTEEAQRAYERALAIVSSRNARRGSRRMDELEVRLRASLARNSATSLEGDKR